MIIRLFLLILVLFSSCSQPKKETDTIRVSVLRGPSAIAFAQWMEKAPSLDGRLFSIRLVDSPDMMQASLIKGETDIAVLPMISAANLYNKGIHYFLLGCPVWGTLYLVGKYQELPDSMDKLSLYLFGSGTTPDVLTRYYLKKHQLDYTLNYSFSTAPEIMQGLLAGNIETAVLGEPFLSMALQKDSSLHILADLNNPETSSPGFAQTAIVCHPSLAGEVKAIDSLLLESSRFAVEKPEEAIRILEAQQVFKPGMLTSECIKRCKIDYRPVSEAKEDILYFLRLIEQYEPEALGGKLPDEGFYKQKQ